MKTTFALWHSLTRGDLANDVGWWRDHGRSWHDVARHLTATYGEDISAETIRRWSVRGWL